MKQEGEIEGFFRACSLRMNVRSPQAETAGREK